MASFVTIEAEARAQAGKGPARATRRAGRVPAVIYGAHQEPALIALEPRAVVREIQRPGWQSRLYEVTLDGAPTRALMRDVQLDPVSDQPIHIDFQRLAAGERIHVAVRVVFLNEGISPGLKRGGVLNVVRHSVDVSCDPEGIPEKFEADLGTLDINDNIRFSDLRGTEGARPTITDRDFVIATVAPPTKMAEATAEAAAATAPVAVAAAPAAAAPAPAKGGAGGSRGAGKRG